MSLIIKVVDMLLFCFITLGFGLLVGQDIITHPPLGPCDEHFSVFLGLIN